MAIQKSETSSFGAVLREKRLLRGYTQDQLVARSGNVCSKAFISQLENDRHRRQDGESMQPDIEVVDALAEALGEPRNYFRKLTGHPSDEDQQPLDEVSAEFASALHRYRQLGDRQQSFVKRQLRGLIDFLLEDEELQGETPVQRIQHKDAKSLPGITLAEAQRRAKKK